MSENYIHAIEVGTEEVPIKLNHSLGKDTDGYDVRVSSLDGSFSISSIGVDGIDYFRVSPGLHDNNYITIGTPYGGRISMDVHGTIDMRERDAHILMDSYENESIEISYDTNSVGVSKDSVSLTGNIDFYGENFRCHNSNKKLTLFLGESSDSPMVIERNRISMRGFLLAPYASGEIFKLSNSNDTTRMSFDEDTQSAYINEPNITIKGSNLTIGSQNCALDIEEDMDSASESATLSVGNFCKSYISPGISAGITIYRELPYHDYYTTRIGSDLYNPDIVEMGQLQQSFAKFTKEELLLTYCYGYLEGATSTCIRLSYNHIYASHAISTPGSGLTELFEWEDGNPSSDDRVGKFITLIDDKIKIATPEDDYILGVIDPNPYVIGDEYDYWPKKYLLDVFGRPLHKEVRVEPTYDHEGRELTPGYCYNSPMLNPDYDESQEYIYRQDRPEYAAITSKGKVVMIDDGTCVPGKFATVGEGGIATHSDDNIAVRVLSRVDENHVRVYIDSVFRVKH